MGENQDISKIIGIIMENPDIIAKIRSLAAGEGNDSSSEVCESTFKAAEEKPSVSNDSSCRAQSSAEANKRRRALLNALKPYVKCERAKTIDTMLTVIDVIDVMKER